MVLLQHKLSVKLSQRQILTPGLVQMVSVLALNKLELKDMINAEMVENPVLEELEESVPLIDEVGRKDEDRDRATAKTSTEEAPITAEKKDPFEEIDFGSFFQDYLDPGYRTRGEMEEIERPSFENFLSKPTNLTDHLAWQLGALSLRPEVREAAEQIIGNLNEDGYLIASDEEMLGVEPPAPPEADAAASRDIVTEAQALGLASDELADRAAPHEVSDEEMADAEPSDEAMPAEASLRASANTSDLSNPIGSAAFELPGASGEHTIDENSFAKLASTVEPLEPSSAITNNGNSAAAVAPAPESASVPQRPVYKSNFTAADLQEALEVVRQLDPPGVGCRSLRECLLRQLQYHQQQLALIKNGDHKNGDKVTEKLGEKNGNGTATAQLLQDAIAIVDQHLRALQSKQHREIAKAISRPADAVQQAVDYIRTLDPRPGLQYNKGTARLIEPDVAFIKHGDEWLVLMNDDDLPQLRLNPAYKKLLTRDTNDKNTRDYVKERYKSAIQLIKNIEQRKQTITKVCYSIVARQYDFLENGIDHLKPMMIKEVAEEIGVHPSTVSRAVASKYAHTPQGVFELRYFFSESVQGPEGGNTSLLILKRRVKKLIEDEDPSRPLTDEQLTRILQSQGIQVTRRTVAKYREDMRIPSTHQRRVKE
ncbi:MAG TPA: RNA polymerase factor sigma-54 [Candidatus Dormibacteraeota bacterium]|nr:RNA polymerase factor sigma-54 [Candidatus Dormibacteraeota bacterium]